MGSFGARVLARAGLVSIALCVAGGLIVGSACTAAAGNDIVKVDPIAEVTQRLARRLFPLSVARSGGRNAVVSPFSLCVTLHMAAGGAGGSTEKAFREALGIDAASTEAYVEAVGRSAGSVASDDPQVTFRSVGGLWLASDAKPVPAYLALLRNSFQARIETADFSKPEAVKDINDWFADQTQQMIPNMVSQLRADTRLLLANALYFKGRWTTPFHASNQPAPFHLTNGKTADVPMMHHGDDSFQYAETSSYQAVKLPFGKGDFEVVVALPKQGVDPAANAVELISVASMPFSERSGWLALPRLKLSAGGDVRPVLEAFGLKDAFSNSADFSRLTESRVRFDQVIHRVALSWDEQGAEAAAGTAVVLPKPGEVRADRFDMNVDRPFVFVLRHVRTGAAILVGLVNNPLESPS